MSTLVTSQEPKFEFEFLDGLQAIRNSLTANILKKIITGFYTFNTDERDNLLGYIPVDAMENGSNENTSESVDQTPKIAEKTPESDTIFEMDKNNLTNIDNKSKDQSLKNGDFSISTDYEIPNIEDQTPESEDQTPESEDQTPVSEDHTPESDKNTPDEKELFCSSHAPLLPEVSFSSYPETKYIPMYIQGIS